MAFVSVLFLLSTHTAAHAGQVTLGWNPSSDPRGVAHYSLYYGTQSRIYSSYVDVGAETAYTLTGLENDVTYYAVVTAYDEQRGLTSAYSNEVSFTLLAPGWNLISLPLQPLDTAIASVLSGIKGAYEVVWAYPDQAWQVYDPNDAAGSTLTGMQAGMGYWIKMTDLKTLSVSGSAPRLRPSCFEGWNLVGYNGTPCVAA